ncbi:alpha/beta hydrolase [Streptomyces wuyuanensis]|uniref:alpha/beta hydrolase n=1 Tax=Streptomyces wuyuanensis TaxID=1196353 RepID=UPI00370FF94F
MTVRTAGGLVLEAAARRFVEAASKPPFPYDLGPERAREALAAIQSGESRSAQAARPPVESEWVAVPAEGGGVRVRIVRPRNAARPLPAVLYMHGGGWMLGDADTHDRLVRELAARARAAVVFVEFSRSPEAHHPVAIEQGYAAAQWITRHGSGHGLDPGRLAVAGDSAGGNLAAALTFLARERGDVFFVHQSMYYPVTDAGMDTESYRRFGSGYFLTAKAMEWFWDAYVPDPARRSGVTVSPLRASRDELAGLPPAFVLAGEADVLRDEGEAYAAGLRAAGVPVTTVRYCGITHDFMMLDPLRETHAARAAVAQAAAVLRSALGTDGGTDGGTDRGTDGG